MPFSGLGDPRPIERDDADSMQDIRVHAPISGQLPRAGPSRGRDWRVSGRRPARAKPQVTGVIGVSDPYSFFMIGSE